MLNLFLVGGAVRDRLLGKEPHDLDFVVVGNTEAELLAAFPVAVKRGAAFPVYYIEGLGEIALARREQKTGPSHTDFEVTFGPEVTLEEDLSRRDLTINAMAINMATGELIDPFGGRGDLKRKVLRHVGPAFADDPLRVYRVARFAAQLGFGVHETTSDLMRTMGAPQLDTQDLAHRALGLPFYGHGESPLSSLSMERVCEETRKALRAPFTSEFFQSLDYANCLSVHFRELAESVPFSTTMRQLDQAYTLGAGELEMAATLLHNLGQAGIRALGQRIKLPIEFIEAGELAHKEYLNVLNFMELFAFEKVDLVMRAGRSRLGADGLSLVAQASGLGMGMPCAVEGPRGLRRAAELVKAVTAGSLGLPNETCQGAAVGIALRSARALMLQQELGRK